MAYCCLLANSCDALHSLLIVLFSLSPFLCENPPKQTQQVVNVEYSFFFKQLPQK